MEGKAREYQKKISLCGHFCNFICPQNAFDTNKAARVPPIEHLLRLTARLAHTFRAHHSLTR